MVALFAFGSMALWPLPAVLAVVAYVAAAKATPAWGGLPSWLRRGGLDATTSLLIVSSILVSSVALVAWFSIAQPDYRALRGTLLPDLPVPLLFLGVVLFAIVNAVLEAPSWRPSTRFSVEGLCRSSFRRSRSTFFISRASLEECLEWFSQPSTGS